VAGVEFVCGSLVAVGFVSSPACVAFSDRYDCRHPNSSISNLPKGLSFFSWLDDLLYLPEVLYVLFFIWLIALVRERSVSIPGSLASYQVITDETECCWAGGSTITWTGREGSSQLGIAAALAGGGKVVLIDFWTSPASTRCDRCLT